MFVEGRTDLVGAFLLDVALYLAEEWTDVLETGGQLASFAEVLGGLLPSGGGADLLAEPGDNVASGWVRLAPVPALDLPEILADVLATDQVRRAGRMSRCAALASLPAEATRRAGTTPAMGPTR